ISWVELIFDLHETVVVDGPQKAFGQCFQEWKLGGLDKCAGAAELDRVLASSTHNDASDGLGFLVKCAVSKLLLTATGDQILDHDLTWSDQGHGSLEEHFQLRPGIGSPRLYFRRVDEMLFDCRLNSHRQIHVDIPQFVDIARTARSRNRYLQLLS